jgi:DNA-binding FadR family transcriptional regulator
MAIFSRSNNHLSEFLKYISDKSSMGEDQLPSLPVLSKELKISVASLREQLEVARVLGFVEVKPRTGIRWIPYDFYPSLLLSVTYSISIKKNYFDQFRDFRNHLEAAYFLESVGRLTKNEIDQLSVIVARAEKKIDSKPPQLPHSEHRAFHAEIFSKVKNHFVQSVFSVYWDVYEYQGYAIINDLNYLKRVWYYPREVFEGIQAGNFTKAFESFLEHKDLMIKHNKQAPTNTFE